MWHTITTSDVSFDWITIITVITSLLGVLWIGHQNQSFQIFFTTNSMNDCIENIYTKNIITYLSVHYKRLE